MNSILVSDQFIGRFVTIGWSWRLPCGVPEAPQLSRSVRRTSCGGIAKAENNGYDNTYGIEYEKWGAIWAGSIWQKISGLFRISGRMWRRLLARYAKLNGQ